MKKFKNLLALLLAFLFVQVSLAQIAGTPHDFSGAAYNTSGEICIVCHTPHNADVTVAEAPLWNKELSAVATYSVYSSGSIDADGGTIGQPAATSKLCLSCHDGTVALENFGGATGGTTFMIAGKAVGGGANQLSDDHPISFTYNTALVGNGAGQDPDLYDPSVALSGLGGTIANDMLFGASNDQVECASCHDVHDAAGLGASGHLLVKANTTSQLCLTCHNK